MSCDDLSDESGESSRPNHLLLQASRTGNSHIVRGLLEAAQQGRISLDVNCKGVQKSNSGWTPLHLACYFGHLNVTELLLEHGANIDVVNNEGDTPLHKCSYTGREEMVLLLLTHNASVFIKNSDGQTAKQVAKSDDVRNLLQAAEESDNCKKQEKLFAAVRDGDLIAVKAILEGPESCNINCRDKSGNTALHCAAYRGRKEIAICLLQMGVDTRIRNKSGQLAIDLASSQQMKQILAVQPIRQLQKTVARVEGALLRKARFLGWKPVWAVLERGVLSFFHSRGDAATGSKRQDFKYLNGADVKPIERNVAFFVIHFSDNSSQVFSICAINCQEEDRQKWLFAFQEHIKYSSHYTQEAVVDSDSENEVSSALPLSTMQDALKSARAHQILLQTQVEAVSVSLNSIANWLQPHKVSNSGDIIKSGTESANVKKKDENEILNVAVQLNGLVDYSKKVASNLAHCMDLFAQQEEVRKMMLQQEQERCRILEDALHALAKEHLSLERSIQGALSPGQKQHIAEDTDCEEFFDASDGGTFSIYHSNAALLPATSSLR